jgi:hypothetical protein
MLPTRTRSETVSDVHARVETVLGDPETPKPRNPAADTVRGREPADQLTSAQARDWFSARSVTNGMT